MLRRTTVITASLLVLLVVAGCSDSKPGESSASTDSAALASSAYAKSAALATTVTIKKRAFSPNAITAKVGDTITFTNEDNTDHSATANDGSFDTKTFSSGSKTFKVTKPGPIGYHCVIHSSMQGEILVSE